jgi:hypothetical protein
MANASPYPPDREIFAWARRDGKVARRVEATEARRTAFFEDILRDAGAGGAVQAGTRSSRSVAM